MQVTDRTAENAIRKQQSLPLLHCPYDCTAADHAPSQAHAYCCHLVGFTRDVDERIMEPLGRSSWSNGEHWAVAGREPEKVQPGDILVNPVVAQKTPHGINYAKSWASARVYRACSPEFAKEWRDKYARPEDFAIKEALVVEDKATRIKNLEIELAALTGKPIEQPIVKAQDEDFDWQPPTEADLIETGAVLAK